MLVSNKEISGELVSLCFGKEIMAEQNAVAAAKSELTLAVSHSAAASESATFDNYSRALIIHELSVAGKFIEVSLTRRCFDFVFVLFQGSPARGEKFQMIFCVKIAQLD